jgi:hypothetical protein
VQNYIGGQKEVLIEFVCGHNYEVLWKGYASIEGLGDSRQTYDIDIIEPAKVWKFPEHKFIEYDKKDEEWAIPLGFGKWVDTEKKTTYYNCFYDGRGRFIVRGNGMRYA